SEDFGVHGGICGSLGVAAFGPHSGGSIRTKLNFALQNGVDAFRIDHKQNKVCGLTTQLKSNVRAFKGHHGWWSPRPRVGCATTAGHGAPAIVAADPQSQLLD